MTEEEMAEDYLEELRQKKIPFDIYEVNNQLKIAFIAGLNKANEWHYVKDGNLPPLNTNVLVIHRWARIPEVGKRITVFTNSSQWVWAMCSDRFRYTSDDENVIAWKEIVLPEEG